MAEVTAYMVETNRMTIEAAKQYLEAHEILGIVRQRESPSQGEPAGPPPSMFYFEEHNSEEETAPGVVTFNVAFDTWTSTPNYLEYTAETEPTSMTSLLFGERTYGWLKELMKLVSQLHLSAGSPTRHNRLEIRKLYTMSIVVNVLARRLMAVLPKETFAFVDDLILGDSKFRDRAKAPEVASRPRGHSQQRSRSGSIADLSARLAAMHHLIPPVVNTYVSEIRAERRGTPSKHGLRDPGEFGVDWLLPSELSLGPEDILPSVDDASEQTRTMAAVGFPLLFAMLQVFQLIVTQRVGHPGLAASILEEQRRVLAAIVCRPLNEPCRSQNDFEDFIGVHCTRFQMTLFLLLEGAALDEATVNEAVLAECKVLGKALDIVAKCHDVARLERDYRLAGGRFALDGSLANNGVVNGAALFAASQGLDAGALFVGVGNADSIELSPAAKDMVAAFLRESLYVTQLSEGARKQYQTFVTVVRKHYGM